PGFRPRQTTIEDVHAVVYADADRGQEREGAEEIERDTGHRQNADAPQQAEGRWDQRERHQVKTTEANREQDGDADHAERSARQEVRAEPLFELAVDERQPRQSK